MQRYSVLAKLLFCQHESWATQWGKGNTEGSLFLFFLHFALASTYCFPQVRGKTPGKSMGGQQKQKSGQENKGKRVEIFPQLVINTWTRR